MSLPRVLLVTGEYPPLPGGIGDYTANLRLALAGVGVESVVLSGRGAHGEGVRVTPDWGWRTYRRVARIVRAAQVDLVHIQYQAGAFDMHVAVNLLPGTVRARLRVPVVTTFHDLRPPFLFPKAGPMRKLSVLRMARMSAGVITTNPGDEAALARARIRSTRIPIGPNLPPPQRGSRAFDPDAIAFFGYPTRAKGTEDLIQACGRLARQQPTTLLFVGEQGRAAPTNDVLQAEEVDRLARMAGVTVERTGRLSPQEASNALASCAVVALPFRSGASQRSGSLLAALQSGRPVVTTAPPNASNLGELAALPQLTLALREDVEDLATAIASVRHSPSSTAPLPGEYRWQSIAARHLEVYEAALAARSRRRAARDS
jgi:glycosyltransferase involved in cell wall biosynthesis